LLTEVTQSLLAGSNVEFEDGRELVAEGLRNDLPRLAALLMEPPGGGISGCSALASLRKNVSARVRANADWAG